MSIKEDIKVLANKYAEELREESMKELKKCRKTIFHTILSTRFSA